MVKRLLLLSLAAFALGAQAQYQIANSNFEGEWDNVTYKASTIKTWNGVEPSGWNSFLTGTGDAKRTALSALASGVQNVITKSTETYDNTKSQTSVQLKPYSVLGIPAQANLTNGCINLGGTTADKWTENYNYTNTGTEGQYGAFRGKPDRIHVWVKFNSTVKYGAKVSCVLHDNTNNGYMQDPYQNFSYISNDAGTNSTTTNYELSKSLANVVAHASKTDIQNSDNWQEIDIPLVYDNPQLTPSYALVTFSTSSAPGKGNSNDVMWVDDFEFIYNSELETAKYDGNTLSFDSNNSVDLSSTKTIYDENKLLLTSNGAYATIEKKYEDGLLKITVKGNDYSSTGNCHVYTIKFYEPAVVGEPVDYIDDLVVTLNGNTLDPIESKVSVSSLETGDINFTLKNFILWVEGAPMPIGNIVVKNLPLSQEDGYNAFRVEKEEITLAAGEDDFVLNYEGENYPLSEEDWSGPNLGIIPLSLSGKITDNILYVAIDIDLTSSIGDVVKVQFGYDLKPYTLSSEYGTICIPTAAALPDGVKAYSCASVTNNVLDLDEVSSLAANTPYILQKTGSEASYTILSTEKTSNEVYTTGCLNGVLTATSAPVGSYVLQNLDNKVAFYLVDSEITVPANRCYLTAPAGSVKALAFPDGTLTSISEIQAADEKAVIYDLSGRRVSKATKGIYIINGKKVIK